MRPAGGDPLLTERYDVDDVLRHEDTVLPGGNLQQRLVRSAHQLPPLDHGLDVEAALVEGKSERR